MEIRMNFTPATNSVVMGAETGGFGWKNGCVLGLKWVWVLRVAIGPPIEFQLADSWNNNVNDRLDGIRRKRLNVVKHVAENLERDYDEQTCLSAKAQVLPMEEKEPRRERGRAREERVEIETRQLGLLQLKKLLASVFTVSTTEIRPFGK
ncbi:hypothetical protein Tco_0916545, partial [Tanacetum coccineum]